MNGLFNLFTLCVQVYKYALCHIFRCTRKILEAECDRVGDVLPCYKVLICKNVVVGRRFKTPASYVRGCSFDTYQVPRWLFPNYL